MVGKAARGKQGKIVEEAKIRKKPRNHPGTVTRRKYRRAISSRNNGSAIRPGTWRKMVRDVMADRAAAGGRTPHMIREEALDVMKWGVEDICRRILIRANRLTTRLMDQATVTPDAINEAWETEQSCWE